MDVATDFTGKENCHNAEKCTIDMMQYPILKEYKEDVLRLVEKYTQKALSNHQDGGYRILLDDIYEEEIGKYVVGSLLADMLNRQPVFQYAEVIDDEIMIAIAPEQLQNNEKEKVGKLTSQESITECGMDMKL